MLHLGHFKHLYFLLKLQIALHQAHDKISFLRIALIGRVTPLFKQVASLAALLLKYHRHSVSPVFVKLLIAAAQHRVVAEAAVAEEAHGVHGGEREQDL